MALDERAYARKRAEQRMQSSWYKLKEGDNCFRILPVPKTPTAPYAFYEYALHRDVGPQKVSVRCGRSPVDGKGQCWICDKLIPHLKKNNREATAAALQSKAVMLIQVAKVDGDAGEETFAGPFLFTPAKTLGDQLLSSIYGNKKHSYIDPVKGYNLNVSRTGTGRNDTKYGPVTTDADPTVVPPEILARVKGFEELKEVPVYSQAKQQAAYSGKQVKDEEEEVPAEPVRQRRPPPVEDPIDDEAVEDDLGEDAVAEDEDFADDAPADEAVDDDLIDDEPPEPVAQQRRPAARPAAKPVAKPAARRPAPVAEPEPEDEAALDDDIPDEDIDLDSLDGEESAEPDDEPPPAPRARPIVTKNTAGARPAARPAAQPAARPAASRVPPVNPKKRR